MLKKVEKFLKMCWEIFEQCWEIFEQCWEIFEQCLEMFQSELKLPTPQGHRSATIDGFQCLYFALHNAHAQKLESKHNIRGSHFSSDFGWNSK